MLNPQAPVSEDGADAVCLTLKELRPLRIVLHNLNLGAHWGPGKWCSVVQCFLRSPRIIRYLINYMKDWRAIAKAYGLDLTDRDLDRIAPPLEALEEAFRPLTRSLTHGD